MELDTDAGVCYFLDYEDCFTCKLETDLKLQSYSGEEINNNGLNKL